ncbi:MAG: GAF domain-containing protein [Acidisphaera sp.]|nr:GAF domain-containing protein [Acidisphaera sp.]
MEAVLGLARVAAEACQAEGPEEALWCITRAIPALLGDPAAAGYPRAFREAAPAVTGAAVAFMLTPGGRHHLITAPVNFLPEQHHELVDIGLGHPGEVARTRLPMLLRDTTLHASFVKILQTFRAGSSMFAPLLWRGDYLGVLICANAARNTFGERDLVAHRAFGALAAACWVAQGGPAWMASLDLTGLPVRSTGT